MSDIPKELVTTAQNGKKYLNIEVNELRQPSQYGATHSVKISVKKADRKEGVNYYIGNLKPSKYGNEVAQVQTPEATMGAAAAMPQSIPVGFETSDNDGLPF